MFGIVANPSTLPYVRIESRFGNTLEVKSPGAFITYTLIAINHPLIVELNLYESETGVNMIETILRLLRNRWDSKSQKWHFPGTLAHKDVKIDEPGLVNIKYDELVETMKCSVEVLREMYPDKTEEQLYRETLWLTMDYHDVLGETVEPFDVVQIAGELFNMYKFQVR